MIALLFLFVVAVALAVRAIATAPIGYEASDGFHLSAATARRIPNRDGLRHQQERAADIPLKLFHE